MLYRLPHLWEPSSRKKLHFYLPVHTQSPAVLYGRRNLDEKKNLHSNPCRCHLYSLYIGAYAGNRFTHKFFIKNGVVQYEVTRVDLTPEEKEALNRPTSKKIEESISYTSYAKS